MTQGSRIIRRKLSDLNVEAIRKVTDLLKTVNYGTITLHVQAGKVYQINRTESCRVSTSIIE